MKNNFDGWGSVIMVAGNKSKMTLSQLAEFLGITFQKSMIPSRRHEKVQYYRTFSLLILVLIMRFGFGGAGGI